MVWLVFGLSFVFMINLLMMDHIRNVSKKLVQSSKKSLRKLNVTEEIVPLFISVDPGMDWPLNI